MIRTFKKFKPPPVLCHDLFTFLPAVIKCAHRPQLILVVHYDFWQPFHVPILKCYINQCGMVPLLYLGKERACSAVMCIAIRSNVELCLLQTFIAFACFINRYMHEIMEAGAFIWSMVTLAQLFSVLCSEMVCNNDQELGVSRLLGYYIQFHMKLLWTFLIFQHLKQWHISMRRLGCSWLPR